MASILETIADMGARLSEMHHQLLQLSSENYHPQEPRQHRRIPYAYSHRPPVNAIPLQPHVVSSSYQHPYPSASAHQARPSRQSYPSRPARPVHSTHSARPAHSAQSAQSAHPSIPLSAVLSPQEEVTFQVILQKGEDGQPIYASFVALFDGTQLNVIKNDLVASMIGQQSAKPGELLYRFIDALKEGGHLKRTFTVAPWKLCYVVRDRVNVTLEVLRRNILQGQPSVAL